MNTTIAENQTPSVITSSDLLNHWQGHRSLTRRAIEAFPEKDFFEFSVGGMRPFAAMVKELLAIAAPGLRQIATGSTEELKEDLDQLNTKAAVLAAWDETTAEINQYWAQIPDEKFKEKIVTFGQYEGTVWSSIFYFIDNEIHHRAQGYVFLRALGIEPPYFWER
ncbi:DinB family protein [Pontibacter sp. 13R65]|uniref:DinB family protein n=1 Tax=Pontibacter sp. 13R65 TaxID=3127458 RepID=UPI00301DCAD8